MLPLLIGALILSWPLVNELALEPLEADLVPIGTVPADPQHYLKTVRFRGTITRITSCLFRVAAERLMPICLCSKTRQEALKSMITVVCRGKEIGLSDLGPASGPDRRMNLRYHNSYVSNPRA
jgi:hypothetical protein